MTQFVGKCPVPQHPDRAGNPEIPMKSTRHGYCCNARSTGISIPEQNNNEHHFSSFGSDFPGHPETFAAHAQAPSGLQPYRGRLVQETYLRVVEHESIEKIGNLSAYVFRIANNLAIDYARRAVTRAQSRVEALDAELVCPKPRPDRVAELDQELNILSRLIGELPSQCRRIFLLHKVEHPSHVEIAKRLNISPRTVETQIGKALRILRDRLRQL